MLQEIQEIGSHAMDIYDYLLAGIGKWLTQQNPFFPAFFFLNIMFFFLYFFL